MWSILIQIQSIAGSNGSKENTSKSRTWKKISVFPLLNHLKDRIQ